MKTKFTLLVLLTASLVISSCTGRKHLEKGNYDEAVYKSIKRLRSNPDNRKAKEILGSAYKYSRDEHLREINIAKATQDPFRWDNVVWRYEKINNIHDEIKKCPACMKVVKNPSYFVTELDSARSYASRAHFDRGVELMESDNKLDARVAYDHFLKARNFTPQHTKINQWMNAALEKATVHVVLDEIPVHSRALQLSNEFFQNKIREFAQGLNYRFVRFYSPAEADAEQVQVDEVITIQFDDFVVGQTFVKEKVENVRRDSVKVGEMASEDGTKIPVYGTVEAELHTFRKTITSTGLMDFQIRNAFTGETVRQKKIPGTYVWESEWGFFNGEKEALSDEQLAITRRREGIPPAPQDLFIAFTQPIYGQIITELRGYYRIHN